jgi:type I restriction-modification system DNA methylase subunit
MATSPAHMTLADIARLAGVGRPAVSNWRRRYADFPQPVLETRSGPRFDPTEVEVWLAAHGKGKSAITPQERLWRAIEAQRGVLPVGRHLATATAFLTYVHLQLVDDRVPSRLGWAHLRMLPKPAAVEGLHAACHLIEAQQAQLRDVLLPDLSEISDERFALLEILYALVQEYGVVQVFEALLSLYDRSGSRIDAEWVTPTTITRLLIGLARPLTGVVLDPAAGAAGFLLAAEQSAGRNGIGRPRLLGQELNPQARRIGQRRLLVHGIDATIAQGDSLVGDAITGVRADIVLLDAPYAMRLDDRLRDDSRWSYGTPPKHNADMAWLQQAIRHLADSGRAFVVLPVGSLFRGGQEAKIRRAMVRRGTIEAIIALPAGLHPVTGSPLAIWVLRPPTAHSTAGDVLFIDASRLGDRTARQTRLGDNDLERIIAVYRQWRDRPDEFADEPGFSRAASIDEILTGGCNLVPGRHVAPPELADPSAIAARLEEKLATWHRAARAAAPPVEPLPRAPLGARGQATRRRTVDELIQDRWLTVQAGVTIRRDDLRDAGTPVFDINPPTAAAHGRPRGRCVSLQEVEGAADARTRAGDVVFIGTPPNLHAVVDEKGGHVVPAPAHILRIRDDRMNPYALAACLQSTRNRQYAEGVSAMRVNVRMLEVPDLDPAAQQRLADTWRELVAFRGRLHEAMQATDELADIVVTASMAGLLTTPERDE